MPISHVTKVFAASDAKIWPLLTDPAAAAATYGTGIDIPGIRTVEISGDVNVVELRGDNTLLDAATSLTNIQVSVEFAKQSLDLLAAFFGNTVADSGTTPSQKAVWNLGGGATPAYTGLTCKAVGADVLTGDVQFSLHKMILASFPEMGLAEEEYAASNVEFLAVPTIGTSKWLTVTLNETGAVLAAPA